MPSKLLIVGGTGLLGSELACHFAPDYDIIRVGSNDVDIRDFDQITDCFNKFYPDLVMNCAAVARVDLCENEKDLAYAVNCAGAENLARACNQSGSFLVHYSTDYVFDGEKKKPYIESDSPNPINVYGQTKLEAERRIKSVFDDYVILRVAWLYADHERSFLHRLVRRGLDQLEQKDRGDKYEPIEMVIDQVGTPTNAMDVARQTEILVEKKMRGLFHCTANGEVSRHYLAELVFRHLSMPVDLIPVKREDFGFAAPRPPFTVLKNAGLRAAGLDIMPDYGRALRVYLERMEKAWTR